jgi:hypothetical protein
MGPLEKLKAFGLSPLDIPKAAWQGISDSFDKKFGDHAVAYETATDQALNEAGSRNADYNRTKGYFGGLDYMLRYSRLPEDAAKIARLYQYKQAMFRDPKQDLLDLDANLAGIQDGASLRGKVNAANTPQDPTWEELMNRARDYANRMRH